MDRRPGSNELYLAEDLSVSPKIREPARARVVTLVLTLVPKIMNGKNNLQLQEHTHLSAAVKSFHQAKQAVICVFSRAFLNVKKCFRSLASRRFTFLCQLWLCPYLQLFLLVRHLDKKMKKQSLDPATAVVFNGRKVKTFLPWDRWSDLRNPRSGP